MSNAQVDSQLTAQISAADEDTPIQAVFTLRSDDPSQPAPSPERTEELARGIVDRVCKLSGVEPERVNVFKYLGSFAISAKPQFISELIEQPEVATAVANLR